MPAAMQRIGEFLTSPHWTEGEKFVIEAQFGLLGGFRTALWKAICAADEKNQALLALVFPTEVNAYQSWANGDLAQRLRNAGLDI